MAMYLQNIDIRHLNGETFLQRPPHPAGRQDCGRDDFLQCVDGAKTPVFFLPCQQHPGRGVAVAMKRLVTWQYCTCQELSVPPSYLFVSLTDYLLHYQQWLERWAFLQRIGSLQQATPPPPPALPPPAARHAGKMMADMAVHGLHVAGNFFSLLCG
jgi:hypothetical protein